MANARSVANSVARTIGIILLSIVIIIGALVLLVFTTCSANLVAQSGKIGFGTALLIVLTIALLLIGGVLVLGRLAGRTTERTFTILKLEEPPPAELPTSSQNQADKSVPPGV